MWIQRLPQRTREILSINTKLSLDEQAQLADQLYTTYKSSNSSQVSAAQTTTATSNDMINTLISLVQNFQT